MTRDELLAASKEPNIAAMLAVIRACEGTAGPEGYRTLFGYDKFESLARHPEILVEKDGYRSTAAGAYQFLKGTWNEIRLQYDLPSFEPEWQDAGAVGLFVRRGALELVRSGLVDAAVERLNKEWASLPGSPYGQPRRSLGFVRKVYAEAGGRFDGGAPIEARTAPSEGGKEVSPFVIPALEVLARLVPTLGKLFAGESPSKVAERNREGFEAIASSVVPLLVKGAGAANLQDAVERAETDSTVAAGMDEALRKEWFMLQEKSIKDAREFAVAYSANPNVRTVLGNFTFIEILSLLLAFYGMLGGAYVIVMNEQFGSQIVGGVITLILIGGYIGVKEFWLGTSSESQRKTDMIAHRTEGGK
jgi:muramidase (phage lysozyme)